MEKIKVLFIAAELNPIAKVGGLADVIGALPKALAKHGVDVRLVIPKYGIVDEKKFPLKKVVANISVPFKGTTEMITVYETPLPGTTVPVYLIDNYTYLGQNGVYFESDASSSGSNREAERFTFFSRACLEIFEGIGWYPDIVHCHDWHVGLVPVLLKILGQSNPALHRMKIHLSIHNMEYQGSYSAEEIFSILNLSESSHPTLKIRINNNINALQQAILNADSINTVSPAYAQEILTPEYGAGLELVLKQRQHDLTGILNGIDIDHFNPAVDQDIITTYTAEHPDGKMQCKADLQKICGLAIKPDVPILGIVSRLASQKGLELIDTISDALGQRDIQFVLLGTGDRKLEGMMRTFMEKFPKKVFCKIAFDAKFAQQIYAGSDIFLMPSRFEPCGLGQMIAMRYGTVPVVRATGGLKDTVQDIGATTSGGEGFVFEKYEGPALLQAIDRAVAMYRDRKKWYTILVHDMQQDFSWKTSAKQYLGRYQQLLT